MTNKPLDCLKCPSLCCKMAGQVEVSRKDVKRLARFLDLSVEDFVEKHIVEKTKRGTKIIKSEYLTCQFLSPTRKCTVYKARPKNCREFVCWRDDDQVYDYARFVQLPVRTLRKIEAKEQQKK